MTEELRRATDRGVAASAVRTASQTSRSFWGWFRREHVDGMLVLFVMLWAIVRAVDWAFEFPYDNKAYTGAEVAMILGAVLGPMGILQALLFNIYVKLRSINGVATEPKLP